jgi:hypothetical protein
LDYVLYLFRWLSGFVPMVNMPNPETKWDNNSFM